MKLTRFVLLIVLLCSAYIIGYNQGNTKKSSAVNNKNSATPSSKVSPTIVPINDEQERIKQLINTFESLMIKRNGEEILKIFTPPANADDANQYSFLLGSDLVYNQPVSPRLLAIANFSSYNTDFKILNINTKSNPIIAEVQETRKDYNNADGQWSKEYNINTKIEIIRNGINYYIDRYYATNMKPTKYGF